MELMHFSNLKLNKKNHIEAQSGTRWRKKAPFERKVRFDQKMWILCKYFSENYTCVNAERENKYFFCAKPSDCTGPDAGGIRVAGKSCPKAYYCCHWGE